MLISAQDILRKLAEQKSALMQDTFTSPPPDYAAFSKALGAFNTLSGIEMLVRELARREDDK